MTLRRRGTLVLVAMLFLTVAGPVSAQELPPGGTFVDDDGNIHEGFIEAIAAEGVTRGCNPPDNDRYCPADGVTRGEMAAFLKRALALPATSTDHFGDDSGSVFEDDINALAEAGVTRGCDPPANENFCPDDPVTRGQMAAFLVRGFGYTDSGAGDLFVDDDNSVFEGDIDRLGTAGVTRGCNPPTNDRFCPEDVVLRDQMASFLGRALELAPRTPPPTMTVAPYFFLDEVGHPNRSGPFLAPLARRVAQEPTTARASLMALLAGPTSDESSSIPAVSTEIPAETELNSVTINSGLATVDLSSEFVANQPSPAAARRVAQVVFTLTRFNSVDRVLFRQDGAAVSVRTDNGALVSRAVTRDDYLDFQAAVSVENPLYGGNVSNPLRVTGVAAAFEAVFEWALTDGDGVIIEEGFAMAESGIGFSPFDFTIDYTVDRTQLGALIVWIDSAADGTRIDIREYPIFLTP